MCFKEGIWSLDFDDNNIKSLQHTTLYKGEKGITSQEEVLFWSYPPPKPSSQWKS